MCRTIYLGTALVAIAPGLWALAADLRTMRLLEHVNHVGMGVLAQTSLRPLLALPWLRGPHPSLRIAGQPPPRGTGTEVELVALPASLTQAIHRTRAAE